MSSESFQDFRQALAAGEGGAWEKLHADFFDRLARVAARRLDARIRPKTDPESVVNSAMKTLYRKVQANEVELIGWAPLFGLLVEIVGKKCLNRNRYYHQARRNVAREQPSAAQLDANKSMVWGPPDPRSIAPEDDAVLQECLDRLEAELNAQDREILRRFMDDESPDAIAAAVGCSPRSAYRVLETIRKRLEDWGRNTA
jgi:DNA-directed RNA polymerase specialized sigma24 family protein